MLDVRFIQKLHKQHEATSAFKRYRSKKTGLGMCGGRGEREDVEASRLDRFRVWDSTLKPKLCSLAQYSLTSCKSWRLVTHFEPLSHLPPCFGRKQATVDGGNIA